MKGAFTSMKYLLRLKTLVLAATFVCMATTMPLTAMAVPLVDYTVSGSAGNWILDFSVTNNLTSGPADMDLYWFGVQLSTAGVVGSPAGFSEWSPGNTFSNATLGGSNIVYNDIWFDGTWNALLPGSTLSSFQAHVTDLTAPTSVAWTTGAYSITHFSSSNYTGGDNFYFNYNPRWEGYAHSASAVPEPSTLLLLGSGLMGLAAWMRKKAA
jgi:hypothetical protein